MGSHRRTCEWRAAELRWSRIYRYRSSTYVINSVCAAALLVYRSAWTKDCIAERVTREAAMATYYATEAAPRVLDQALQLHGGLGVVSGMPVEVLYRDIRALRIYEGASEVQKTIIGNQTLAVYVD